MGDRILYDSAYAFIDGEPLSYCVYTGAGLDIQTLLSSKVLGKVEYVMMEALYKYPFITMDCVRRYVCVVLGVSYEQSFFRHCMERLTQLSIVMTVSYGTATFYTLNAFARKQLKKRLGFDVVMPDEITVSAVLEYGSLGQWHISVMEDTTAAMKTSVLYQVHTFHKRRILVPSFICFKKGALQYRICSFASPRGRTDIAAYLNSIKDVWQSMSIRRKNTVNLTVITVSSLTEIRALNAVICRFFETFQKIYYVVDGDCAAYSGMSCLYCFDRDEEEKSVLKVVEVK